MDVILTKQATQKILIGILIVAFGDIVIDAIFTPSSMDFAQGMMSNNMGSSVVQKLLSQLLVLAAGVVGYVFYLGGLTKLSSQLDSIGMAGAKQVRTAIIIMIISAAVAIIPVIGWVATGVLAVIGWALMASGFNKMEKSETFSKLSCKAVKLLSTAAIIGLIGECVDFIPLMGWAVWCLMVVSLALQITGWMKLNSSIQ